MCNSDANQVKCFICGRASPAPYVVFIEVPPSLKLITGKRPVCHTCCNRASEFKRETKTVISIARKSDNLCIKDIVEYGLDTNQSLTYAMHAVKQQKKECWARVRHEVTWTIE